MVHITSGELAELRECVSALGHVLARLDRLGAGIAAIHVDAAIEQLKNNIDFNAPGGICSDHAPLLCDQEFCAPPRSRLGITR
jgi:hypothetical protein